jgi:hypothetical protein
MHICLLISNNQHRTDLASLAIKSKNANVELWCKTIQDIKPMELPSEVKIDSIYLDSSLLAEPHEKCLKYFETHCSTLWIFFIEDPNSLYDMESLAGMEKKEEQIAEDKGIGSVHFFKWVSNRLSDDIFTIQPHANEENEMKSSGQPMKKMAIPTMDGYLFIQTDEIIRCEARGTYTIIYSLNGKKIISSKNIKEFENYLKSHSFFRIHQTHLINLNKVQRYLKGRGGTVIMEDGSSIEVASRRKNEFLMLFEKST